jgi:hypothetical protein
MLSTRRTSANYVALTLCVMLLSAMVPCSVHAQTSPLQGTVFTDANGNGSQDANERGIANIAVSNQSDVVTTDSNGRFTIGSGTTGIIFVSVPDGYKSSGPFWRKAASAPMSFGLTPTTRPNTFTFIHASDPHIEPGNAPRYRRFRAMADSIHPAFTLMAGDLIRDAMSQQEPLSRSYFELFVQETKPFNAPVFTVPGNHDHFGIIRSRSHIPESHPSYGRTMYREYFGPDYYSFTYGGVHFVGLNTLSVDDSAYYGDVDSVQLAWLKKDLAVVPAAVPIVTFNHIPLASGFNSFIGYFGDALVSSIARVNGVVSYRHSVRNTLDVMEAMEGHRFVLALGAHNHAPEKLTILSDSVRVRFEVSAALVGGQNFGAMIIPSGFTLYTVKNGVIDDGAFVHLDR